MCIVQVYTAFGMTHEVSTDCRRVWNKAFGKPVYEMSGRTRSRALSLVTPALEKMLRAFNGNHWTSLLVYVTNNIRLHSKKAKRENTQESDARFRDLVYREILLRSTFVRSALKRFNLVMGNDRAARDERRRIMSTVALDFPYRVLKPLGWRLPDAGTRYTDRSVSRKFYGAARSHAGAFGPGGNPYHIPIVQEATIKAATIKRIFDYLMDDKHVQKLASGSKDLVLTTGEKFAIPAVARKFLRTRNMLITFMNDFEN